MHGDQGAPRARTAYLPGLDGLRAISVVAVLLYHADMRWLPGGFLGVEVFFVISGYLITLLLSQEFTRHHGIALGQFWLRRARRLLAALYTLLAVVSVVVLVFYREDADELAGQVWAALTYVTNWFLIVIDQSYFATVERPMVFQHLWSLAIEEQFYLLWPVLLLVLLRVSRDRQWAAAIVVTAGGIASLVWMAVLFQPAMDPSRVYYGTDTRALGPAARRRPRAGVEADPHLASRRRGADGRPRPRRDGRHRCAHRLLRRDPRDRHVPLPRRLRRRLAGVVRGDRRHGQPGHRARCPRARPAR